MMRCGMAWQDAVPQVSVAGAKDERGCGTGDKPRREESFHFNFLTWDFLSVPYITCE